MVRLEAGMKAYKFTGYGGATYNGFIWPLPTADGPGEWVEVGKRARKALITAELCTRRVLHATDAAHLLDWLNAEMYEVEIDESRGVIVADKIGFRRGRLVRRIEAWNEWTARTFACDCAEDALQYADDDSRSTLECAIYVARCHADGEASKEELAAAGAAARAAVRDAAGAAARAAAGAAAGAAARDAAGAATWAATWAAAWDATWAAARAAVRDAAWAKYTSWLIERLGIA
jgi:hypothetical protein